MLYDIVIYSNIQYSIRSGKTWAVKVFSETSLFS